MFSVGSEGHRRANHMQARIEEERTMNEKAVQAIQHVTTATLADDGRTAVMELDKAGELIDELVEERQGEPEDGKSEDGAGGVRAKAGETVRTVKESVPSPQTPLALAGLGAVAALAFLSAQKVLSRRGEE
jgi:hypothetical protein